MKLDPSPQSRIQQLFDKPEINKKYVRRISLSKQDFNEDKDQVKT